MMNHAAERLQNHFVHAVTLSYGLRLFFLCFFLALIAWNFLFTSSLLELQTGD